MSPLTYITHHFKQLTIIQKIGLLYCIVLFLVILLVPIIQVQHFNNSTSSQIRLFHTEFWIVDLLLITILVKCAWYLVSVQFKSLVLHLTGLKIEGYAVPLICLVMISCIVLTLGATTLTLKNQVTYLIDLTYGYYILCVLLIIGILATAWLIIQDLHRKPAPDSIIITKKTASPSSQIHSQTHISPLEKPRSSLFEEV